MGREERIYQRAKNLGLVMACSSPDGRNVWNIGWPVGLSAYRSILTGLSTREAEVFLTGFEAGVHDSTTGTASLRATSWTARS